MELLQGCANGYNYSSKRAGYGKTKGMLPTYRCMRGGKEKELPSAIL